jgi:arylsulfatase A-like enzyme
VQLEGARIIDVAPTILHLLDAGVPEDFDGRPLLEMFEDEIASREVFVRAASDEIALAETNGDYSADEERTISERLRALGYIN